ncbi:MULTISPECIES: hypothetical protein [Micromonospora]|uniref:Secreted protein n=1 Tax=Micromonospora vinacea TaxID=709878 RepID=A0ABS0JXD7_9ACTN|nr:hypothetical protein [Micromonospora vinacea]MBG6101028.1 hypothetical protein [Micromonospora vinacea]WSZ76087.1 hypothetical protein OH804_30095 [Micromonospora sp. NBC_00860]WTA67427.1 hypothetical protein OHB51_34215 [Micromonospora sp. NBC_00855]
MRPASTTVATVALLAALLTGCTSVDRAPTATPTQPSTTTATGPADPTTGTSQPTTAPTVSAGTSGVAPRVTLRISGGFAGRGESIVVEPDGQWTVTDRAGGRRNGRLTPADQGTLAGLTADPRLATEARQPTTATRCSDVMHYRLSVASNDTGYTTCPEDGTPPPATQAVVNLLLRTTETYVR